jgi:hypothetical protein
MLVYSSPTDAGLNRCRRGLPTLEFRIYDLDHTPSFSSSILHFPLSVPLGLILNQLPTIHILNLPNTNQGIKSPKSRMWNLTLDFYQSSIH